MDELINEIFGLIGDLIVWALQVIGIILQFVFYAALVVLFFPIAVFILFIWLALILFFV